MFNQHLQVVAEKTFIFEYLFIELGLLLQVLGVQTPGFTAAVRLGAELLKHWHDVSAAWCGPVYLSPPCDGKKKKKKKKVFTSP